MNEPTTNGIWHSREGEPFGFAQDRLTEGATKLLMVGCVSLHPPLLQWMDSRYLLSQAQAARG